jgi:ABC-2 type transport system permease protein
MLRLYQRLWQVNWAEQWQYRANLIMYLLYWLVSPVVYLAVWSAIAEAQGSVNGLTANDFATYYLTLLIVDQLTSEITIHIFAYKVQDGTLAGELIRPAHPVLTSALVYNLAFKALSLLGLTPIWLILSLLFRPDFSGVTAAGVLLALPALALGFGVSFLLGAALTCVAFWTTRVWALYELYAGLVVLFSGQFVPLTLMPPAIQAAARFLPFPLYKYVPIQILLGRLTWPEVLGSYALGLAWLAAAWLLFRWVWRAGVRRFSAVGA